MSSVFRRIGEYNKGNSSLPAALGVINVPSWCWWACWPSRIMWVTLWIRSQMDFVLFFHSLSPSQFLCIFFSRELLMDKKAPPGDMG